MFLCGLVVGGESIVICEERACLNKNPQFRLIEDLQRIFILQAVIAQQSDLMLEMAPKSVLRQ